MNTLSFALGILMLTCALVNYWIARTTPEIRSVGYIVAMACAVGGAFDFVIAFGMI